MSTSAKGGGNGKSDPTSSSKSKNPGINGLTMCLFCGAKHKLDDCTISEESLSVKGETSSSANVWVVQPLRVIR